MKTLERTLKTALALFTAVTLATSPSLQAYQLGQSGATCSYSGCCCSCAQSNNRHGEAISIDGVCCCRVSNPDSEVEIPFEAQSRQVSSPDPSAQATCAVSDNRLTEIVCDRPSKIDVPLVHGPPLYVLKSSYLI